MKAGTIRIGFIGAGANTRNTHIPGFCKEDRVELAVVANRSVASAEKVAHQEGIQRVARDWREVVEAPDVDAVCIGTWPYLHAEATIAALEHGKHVLCEARMACNLEEARRMEAAARAHPDLVAQLVPAPFSLDFDTTIRKWIEAEELGDLLEVCVVHTGGSLADPGAPLTWRQNAALSGKNILSMGIMHETVERWIPGEPDWLLADGKVFQPHRLDPETGKTMRVEIPDCVTALGRYEALGARLNYHFSGVESGEPRMEFRLNGSAGALRFDASKKQLLHAKAGSKEENKVTLSRDACEGWRVEADFIRSIREGAPVSKTTFEQGVRYMTFTEMAWDSLENESKRVFLKDYAS
ncbi:MAG: Gfo/Idh/MocA family protein [Opitutales bacterium]